MQSVVLVMNNIKMLWIFMHFIQYQGIYEYVQNEHEMYTLQKGKTCTLYDKIQSTVPGLWLILFYYTCVCSLYVEFDLFVRRIY